MSDKKFFTITGAIAYLSWPVYFLIDRSHDYKGDEIVEAMTFATAAVVVYALVLFLHFKKG
ncbi:hypothetical protein [Salimicrobium halophilum]|uniref:Uncharacterized protein n=1 Tax=Salimicrobium halophilum TaxID=86666 RepID=A0A1G8R3Q3_9BACI|nr:hypothetical protein [Salimicrobium halophilum]SDJ11601.1 hypothetical protein SAMN04490247_0803 [Salimicrobium halophilum]